MRNLLASAWAGGADAKQAQQAQLAALRVQAAMLLPGSAEHSKNLPFTKGLLCDTPFKACVHQWVCLHACVCSINQAGLPHWCASYGGLRASRFSSLICADIVRWEESTLSLWTGVQEPCPSSFSATSQYSSKSGYLAGTPLAKALESKDETLQAAAAALIPVHVILSPRSQAKVAADAMDALKKLSGDTILNKMAPQQACSKLLSYGIAAPTLYSRYSRFSMCAR